MTAPRLEVSLDRIHHNMAELSSLATSLEAAFGVALAVVSGGNSANLGWALGGGDVGRVNDLRLGEAILLGRETLQRRPIVGLHTDAVTLVALGQQDVDPAGLTPPEGMAVLGASSDHLVLDTGATTLAVGAEVRFGVDYAALLRAATSPFVGREYVGVAADPCHPLTVAST